MTKKFTKKELAEFEAAKQAIQGLGQIYDGKKARQSDAKIIGDKEGAIKRSNDPNWLKTVDANNKKLAKDPTWLKGQKKRNQDKRKDPEHVAIHLAATRDNPEFGKAVSIRMEKDIIDPTSNFSRSIANRSNNTTWTANNKKATSDPERNKKIGIKTSKEIQTNLGLFSSLTKAMEFFINQGIKNPRKVIFNGLKNNPKEFYYTNGKPPNKIERKKGVARKVITDLGVFKSVVEAGEAHGIHADTIKYRIKAQKNGYGYISEEEYILLTGKEILDNEI